ncbi:uncharacterized protein BDV14DRAFT_194722 [Aspergillus stella-maris]|uniref:uncharacterized protein n=1 Tax=Aspergillus stella-maris TaxID=1810926 RepID=UPI003CCCC412
MTSNQKPPQSWDPQRNLHRNTKPLQNPRQPQRPRPRSIPRLQVQLHHRSKQQLRDKEGSDLFEILAAFASPPDDNNQPVLEIMQPVKGQTLMQEYLDTHGNQEGVQHLAFRMDDRPMRERKDLMRERGFKPAMQGWWRGNRGEANFVFFDTLEKGLPTCFETIEFSDNWEEPECEWYPGPPGGI